MLHTLVCVITSSIQKFLLDAKHHCKEEPHGIITTFCRIWLDIPQSSTKHDGHNTLNTIKYLEM
jgi:hypothetical protein